MDTSKKSQKVIMTTKGLVCCKDITGILIHEHVFNRFPYRFKNESEDFSLMQLNKLYSHEDKINVVVDLTPYTQPYNYYNVIDNSPIYIVSCIGFYTKKYITSSLKKMSETELLNNMSKKIENGIGSRKIHPGILKIAAQRENLSPLEHKLFKVISKLSSHYNLPVALHTPFSPYDHAKTLIDYGVSPSKLMVSHIENGISNKTVLETHMEEACNLAKIGCYIQLSDFGSSTKSIKANSTMKIFKSLYDQNLLDKILISSDCNWHWKSGKPILRNLNNYSQGRTYSYTLDHILPLINSQIGKDLSDKLLKINPLHFISQEINIYD